MHKKLSLVLLLAIAIVTSTLAQTETDDDLQALLDSYCSLNAPAVALYVWTPDAAYGAATGVVELNGEALTLDDRFRIGSVSKTYTAVATLQLVSEGAIDLDAPIAEYLPTDFVDSIDGAEAVTVRHLLTMSSGLYEYLQDDFYNAVDDDPNFDWTPEIALEDFVFGQEAVFEPGTEFEYTNTNYLLLQLIIEAVTDKPLHEVVRDNILDPIGAEDTYTQVQESLPGGFVHGYEDLDGDGELDDATDINDGAGMGDGALVATAADVARFYEALFYEEILLEDAMVTAMLVDPLGNEYGMGIEVFQDDEYGLIYGHSGSVLGFTSDARYFADEEIIVVLLHADLELDDTLIYEAVALVIGE